MASTSGSESKLAKNDNVLMTYTSDAGSHVSVPRQLNPFEELGLSDGSTGRTASLTRQAFASKICNPSRQARVRAALAYDMITFPFGKAEPGPARYTHVGDDVWEINNCDLHVLCTVGDTKAVFICMGSTSAAIKRQINRLDVHGRSPLYLAARNGHYDLTRRLLEAGADINLCQHDKSTPLHGASFYGHVPVLQLLLEHGANPHAKNGFDLTPKDECRTAEGRKVFSDFESRSSGIDTIRRKITDEVIGTRLRLLSNDGTVVAKELVIDPSSMSKADRDSLASGSWTQAWHGTRASSVASICKHGIIPAGSKIPGTDHVITPPTGQHFPIGHSYFGIENWAAAIFVSPSLLYACHPCYADRVFDKSVNWAVVMRVRVREGSYTRHDTTVMNDEAREALPREPELPEFRIQSDGSSDCMVQRIGSSDKSKPNVVVFGVLLVRVSFLEGLERGSISYDKLDELFGPSSSGAGGPGGGGPSAGAGGC